MFSRVRRMRLKVRIRRKSGRRRRGRSLKTITPVMNTKVKSVSEPVLLSLRLSGTETEHRLSGSDGA